MDSDIPQISNKYKIAVVIPAYKVEQSIHTVLSKIQKWIYAIIVIDDGSPDKTSKTVRDFKDDRITLIIHHKNQGIGAALLSGYSYALNLGVEIVVKIDGDDQMNLDYLPDLLEPILNGTADYTKGNRFLHPVGLKNMPLIRKIGNLGLTFLTKITSGYWNIFDPTNGYTAISSEKLQALDPNRIARDYFFETSMLCELRRLNAVVEDVPMPAIYQDEQSSLNVSKELIFFSAKLLSRLLDRIVYRYFLYDFTAVSFYLVSGAFLGLFGTIWGLLKWVKSYQTNIPATTGTVLIAVLPIILAVQFLVQAVALDISDVPVHVRKIRNFPLEETASSLMNKYFDLFVLEKKAVVEAKGNQ